MLLLVDFYANFGGLRKTWKREVIFLLSTTRNFGISVQKGFRFLLVLRIRCVSAVLSGPSI